jgi:hypothetical protein
MASVASVRSIFTSSEILWAFQHTAPPIPANRINITPKPITRRLPIVQLVAFTDSSFWNYAIKRERKLLKMRFLRQNCRLPLPDSDQAAFSMSISVLLSTGRISEQALYSPPHFGHSERITGHF